MIARNKALAKGNIAKHIPVAIESNTVIVIHTGMLCVVISTMTGARI